MDSASSYTLAYSNYCTSHKVPSIAATVGLKDEMKMISSFGLALLDLTRLRGG